MKAYLSTGQTKELLDEIGALEKRVRDLENCLLDAKDDLEEMRPIEYSSEKELELDCRIKSIMDRISRVYRRK